MYAETDRQRQRYRDTERQRETEMGKETAPIAWSARLAITLVRGMPGTLALHRRTLEALGLRKCYRTVIRPNTPTIRGQVQQVIAPLPAAFSCFFFFAFFLSLSNLQLLGCAFVC